MTSNIQVESRVGKDGVLTLRVPLSPSDADTEVIVTIRPKCMANTSPQGSDWPPGYFEQTYGCLANDPMAVPDDPVPAQEEIE
jgi:hypothetical protein